MITDGDRSYTNSQLFITPSKQRTYLFSSMSAALAQHPNLKHPDRFIRRIEYIRYVLLLPQRAVRDLSDIILARRFEEEEAILNKDLFYAVAQLEERYVGAVFVNDEANSIAKFLRPRMRKEFNVWPQSPSEWRSFIMHQWPPYLQKHGA